LKQSIAALNDKVKEAEQIKSEKLRTALLIERKKFCNFLSMWSPVVTCQIDLYNELGKFRENQSYWTGLASSYLQLPNDVENMIKTQERTLVAIQGNQEDYSYSNSWDTSYDNSASYNNNNSYGSYDNYNTGNYNTGYPPQQQQSQQSYSLGTCTALYNFAGEQAEDLPFYAGDVISILQEDDGSGWLHGELNGARGVSL